MSGGEFIGAKAVEQIATAIVTTMDSPAREIGNYIADKIRYLRYGSLLNILEKAEKKAKIAGMSVKMPPLKFFVPFCEAASLEDSESDNVISDLWANLLLSSQDSNDPRFLLYLRILREISRSEAEFLVNLVECSRANTNFKNRSWSACEDVDIFDQEQIELFIDDLPQDYSIKKIIEKIIDCLECPGVWIKYVTAWPNDYSSRKRYHVHEDFDKEDLTEGSVQILESLGLVQNEIYLTVRVRDRDDISLHIEMIRIKPLGYAFYRTVVGHAYEKAFLKADE